MREKSVKIFLLASVCALLSAPCASAGNGLYSFPTVDDEKQGPVKNEEPEEDPFILQLATRTGTSEDVLSDASDKGFGRTELIRLIVMAQKSGKKLEDLMKERESGKSFKEMSKNLNLEAKTIKKEADALYDQIVQELKKPKAPPAPPAPAKPKTAGLDEL